MPRTPDQTFKIQDAMEASILSGDHRRALLVPPGYAKTRPVLSALNKLGAFPALVVAPPVVAESVWSDEAARWTDLLHLRFSFLGGAGRPLRRVVDKRPQPLERAPWWMDNNAQVETVSYDNLPYLSQCVDLERRYRAIVFDEMDALKTPSSVRFTAIRKRAMGIPVRVGMTGSPMPNRYLELWAQMFAVADEAPLGPSFSLYQDKYFQTTDFEGRVWDWKHRFDCERTGVFGAQSCRCVVEATAHIQSRVRPHAYSLPVGQQEVKLPRVAPHLLEVPLPPKVARMEAELRKQLFTLLDSGQELEAISQTAVAVKARQLMAGAVYTDDQGSWEVVHEGKLDRLEALVGELHGAPLVVCYQYRHELELIRERFRRMGLRVEVGAAPHQRELFNSGKLDALVIHPANGGAGVNLQGGCNTCFTTVPWSWRDWEQVCGRQARVGQLSDVVHAYALVCGPLEERVWQILNAKGESQADFLRAIAA
jgi:hypothetical protein